MFRLALSLIISGIWNTKFKLNTKLYVTAFLKGSSCLLTACVGETCYYALMYDTLVF